MYESNCIVSPAVRGGGSHPRSPMPMAARRNRCSRAEVLPRAVFELVFHAGDYFRARAVPLGDPPFLDQIAIRFGVGPGRGILPRTAAAFALRL